MEDKWLHYVELRDKGSSAQEVWNRSVSDGLNWAESVRMIRSVFGLTLLEAKEVKLRAEGLDMSVDEYQRDYILPIVEEADRQRLFDDEQEDSG